MKRIVIVGCGFAGPWTALGAAKTSHDLQKESELEIVVINRSPFHGIRVRYYEEDLSSTRIPLDDLLKPVNVSYIVGEVTIYPFTNYTIIKNFRL
ncbi:hypothetical protein [Legionella hackeliae]|uniref:FAD/NAD(P)-binding domain-containing protein n=1 Tax=Legionella hackeliae TaxID=449 RepID=A0A0A8UNE3_LEGHA|nr:hypothetical protein [Legionella hackeliae]KTD14186.1 exported protein of unknown function [Legionella hackeliae]CEK10395.1 exported protein of unknown function [Legionella hackeliae]STX47131.1 Uncharacterised protein [Legionella hackeliae]